MADEDLGVDDLYHGWLVKRGTVFKRDKRRYFRLTEEHLRYFHYEKEEKPVPAHSIALEDVTSISVEVNGALPESDPRRRILTLAIKKTLGSPKPGAWTVFVASDVELQAWLFSFKQLKLPLDKSIDGIVLPTSLDSATDAAGHSDGSSKSLSDDSVIPVQVHLPHSAGTLDFAVPRRGAVVVTVRELKASVFLSLAGLFNKFVGAGEATTADVGDGDGDGDGAAHHVKDLSAARPTSTDSETLSMDYESGTSAATATGGDTGGSSGELSDSIDADNGVGAKAARKNSTTKGRAYFKLLYGAHLDVVNTTEFEWGGPVMDTLEATDSTVHFAESGATTVAKVHELLTAGPGRFTLKTMRMGLWLDDEDMTVRSMELQPMADGLVHLWMLPADEMPILHSRITHTRSLRDPFNKPYTAFSITVRFDTTEWTMHRRYNDFKILHTKLLADPGINPRSLPELPPAKHMTRTKDQAFLDHRKAKLDRYLQALLSVPEVIASVELLSWLGVVSTSRDDTSDRRTVLHVTKLADYVRPGDVILFQCNNVVSGLQRTFTRSEWDHVGIVCMQRGRVLTLVEATGEGVGLHPLISRVRSYGGDFTNRIAVRRLAGVERNPDTLKRLVDFIKEVDGKPYSLTASKLLRRRRDESEGAVARASAAPAGAAPATPPTPPRSASGSGTELSEDEIASREKARASVAPETFFCSELVATALQEMGALSMEKPPSAFWPADFGEGGAVASSMVQGTFEPEVIVDCCVMEVARASQVLR